MEIRFLELICGIIVCNGHPVCGLLLILDSILHFDGKEDF